jgi:hypothetical protein
MRIDLPFLLGNFGRGRVQVGIQAQARIWLAERKYFK